MVRYMMVVPFLCVMLFPVHAQEEDPAPRLMEECYRGMRQGVVDEREAMDVYLIGRDGRSAPTKHYERLMQYRDDGDRVRVRVLDSDSRNMAANAASSVS